MSSRTVTEIENEINRLLSEHEMDSLDALIREIESTQQQLNEAAAAFKQKAFQKYLSELQSLYDAINVLSDELKKLSSSVHPEILDVLLRNGFSSIDELKAARDAKEKELLKAEKKRLIGIELEGIIQLLEKIDLFNSLEKYKCELAESKGRVPSTLPDPESTYEGEVVPAAILNSPDSSNLYDEDSSSESGRSVSQRPVVMGGLPQNRFLADKSSESAATQSELNDKRSDSPTICSPVYSPIESTPTMDSPVGCFEDNLVNLWKLLCDSMRKKDADTPIKALFVQILKDAANERIDDSFIGTSEDLEAVFESYKKFPSDVKSAKVAVFEILRKVRPLNSDKLLNLIKNNTESAKKIENQDIILLLGATGAGKSTSIQYLAGSSMVAENIPRANSFVRHIHQIETADSVLNSFVSSFKQESETRVINAFRMTLNNGMCIALCDTPGFGDTDGAETDIANGIGIIRALKGTKSIRPLILFCQDDMGRRLEKVKNMSNILSSIFGPSDGSIHTFSYAFTHYDSKNSESIHDDLSTKYDTLTEEDNSDVFYSALIRDMVDKTNPSRHTSGVSPNLLGAMVIDPLDGKSVAFLQQIVAMQAITNPSEKINYFVSSSSVTLLNAQLNCILIYIRVYLKSNLVDAIETKMDQLSVFKHSLALSECTTAFLSAKEMISEAINAAKTIFMAHIEPYFISVDDLPEEKIGTYVSNLLRFSSIDEKYIKDSTSPSMFVQINLKRLCSNYSEKITSWFNKETFLLNHQESTALLIKSAGLVKNIVVLSKLLGNPFEGVPKITSEIFSFLRNILEFTCSAVTSSADSFELNKIGCYLSLANLISKIIIDNYKDIDHSEVLKMITKCEDNFVFIIELKLQLQKDKLIYSALALFIDKESIASYHLVIDALEKASQKDNQILSSHFGHDRMLMFFESFFDHFTGFVLSRLENINNYIANAGNIDIDFTSILNGLGLVKDLVELPSIKLKCLTQVNDTYKKLNDLLVSLRQQFKNQIELLRSDPFHSFNFETLKACCNNLYRASKIYHHENNEWAVYYNESMALSEQFISALSDEAKTTDLSYDQSDHIKMFSLLFKFNIMTQLFESDSDVLKLSDYLVKEIKKNVLLASQDLISIAQETDIQVLFSTKSFGIIKSSISYLLSSCSFESVSVLSNSQEAIMNGAIPEIFAAVNSLESKLEKSFATVETNSARTIEILTCLTRVVNYYKKNPIMLIREKIFDSEVYTQLFSVIPSKILDYWCSDNGKILSHLTKPSEMILKSDISINDVQSYMERLSSYIVFDEFLTKDHFRNLHATVSDRYNLLCKEKNDKELKIVSALLTNDFAGVFNLLETVTDKTSYVESIIIKVKDLTTKISRRVESIDFSISTASESLAVILQNGMVAIDKMEKYLFAFIENVIRDQFIADIVSINKQIQLKVAAYINAADSNLVSCNIYEIENVIANTQKLVPFFKDKDNVAVDSKSSFAEYLTEQCILKRSLITDRIDSIAKKIDLSKYPEILPEFIFEKLRKAEAFSSYENKYKMMAGQVKSQVNIILNQLDELEYDAAMDKLRQLHHLSSLIPKDVFELFMKDIEVKESDIIAKYKLIKVLIDAECGLHSIRILVDKLGTFFLLQRSEVISAICLKINDSAVTFKAQLSKDEMAPDVLSLMLYSLDEWSYFFSKAEQYSYYTYGAVLMRLQEAKTLCDTIFTKVIQYISKCTRNIAILTPTAQSLILKVKCTEIESFFAFAHVIYAPGAGTAYINSRFAQKISSIFSNVIQTLGGVSQYFEFLYKYFVDVLNKGEIDEIHKVMQTCQSLNSLLTDEEVWVSAFALLKKSQKDGLSTIHGLQFKTLKSRFTQTVLAWRGVIFNDFESDSRTKSDFVQRDLFYSEVAIHMRKIIKLRNLTVYIDSNIVPSVVILEETCREKVSEHANSIRKTAEQLVEKMPTSDISVYERFKILFDNLRSMSEMLDYDNLQNVALQQMQLVDQCFHKRMCLQKHNGINQTNQEIVDLILQLCEVSENIPRYHPFILRLYNKILDDVLIASPVRIAKIGVIFAKSSSMVAQKIINEAGSLVDFKLRDRIKKTHTVSIDTVLSVLGDNKNMSGIPYIQNLGSHYEKFQALYTSLIDRGIENIANLGEYIARLPIRSREIISNNKSTPFEDNVRDLMAVIFAYWTLDYLNKSPKISMTTETEETNANEETNEGIEKPTYTLLEPHAVQIIALFQLFGVGHSIDHSFSVATASKFNNFVEVGTGEGKSIVLGVASTALALLGFNVHCSSYSAYLSTRDLAAFSSIFSAFEVIHFIHYGTFNSLCEKFINQHGDIRSLVCDYLSKSGAAMERSRHVADRPTVLLIDEVDVFFKEDFYGKSFPIVSTVKCSCVVNLFHSIWKIREDSKALNFSSFSKTKEYIDCQELFTSSLALIESLVKVILYDLQVFLSSKHEYLFDKVKLKVGYTHQDGITFEMNKSYLTTFAYFTEYMGGKIDKVTLDKQLGFIVYSGEFSYAEIPKQYSCIMGVTGTLKSLSANENDLLKNVYNVRRQSYMPSAYGERANKFDFSGDKAEDFRISPRTSFHYQLMSEINSRLKCKLKSGNKRAVLVFFKSMKHLNSFYNSSEASSMKHVFRLLMESTPTDEKNSFIGQAATSGSITLLTRAFGRGTDFVCYDDNLLESGGAHVISTFFSSDISEEIQMMGRTARQGNCGSFSFVVEEEELVDEFHADINDMRKSGKIYSTLILEREKLFANKRNVLDLKCQEIKKSHDKACSFVGDLLASRAENVMKFLLEDNIAPTILRNNGISRTVILMDSTGSMSASIGRCQQAVAQMFHRVVDILKSNNKSTVVEMMFAGYRNYNAPESEILLASEWTTNPVALESFIETIEASYGMSEEAVEIGFAHVNKQEGVKQVILIADEPPNVDLEMVKAKRRKCRFVSETQPTWYMDELKLMIEKGIVVHTCYVRSTSAKAVFGEIAKASGGTCRFLDASTSSAAEELTTLVCESILSGEDDGKVLVDAYRSRYGWTGSATDNLSKVEIKKM